jgi:hypothetical protein
MRVRRLEHGTCVDGTSLDIFLIPERKCAPLPRTIGEKSELAMRVSNRVNVVMALAGAALVAAGVAACSSEPLSDPSSGEDVGSAGLELQLSADAHVDRVSYVITGPNGFTKTGTINVANSTTVSAVVPGLPAGNGFSITLSATSTNGSVSCAGSATFNVTADATTTAAVHLTCHEGPRTGRVLVNGSVNMCPVFDEIGANPAEVLVGGSIALSAVAHDSDAAPSPLSYHWSASSGSFDHPSSKNTSFTCSVAGTVALTATVSDGDTAAGCDSSRHVDVTCSLPGSGNTNAVLTMAVYGDAPYGTTPTDNSQTLATPGFIANVNADPDVSLVMHVGDIHSGKQFCTEAYNRTVFDLWRRFGDPLVYTPGDNEWSDCHKVAQGGGLYNASTGMIDYVLDSGGNPVDYARGEPLANLALVRTIFFSHPGFSLGGGPKQLLSQSAFFDSAHPTDANYVENVMWEDSKVLFVTIDIPGGSNNDNDIWYGAPTQSPAQAQEIVERTGAGLRWLDAAFAQATTLNAAAVVVTWQADVWDPEKGASHQTAYEPLVQSLANHTLAFAKPVLMFNGDSHVYQSGNPLSPADPVYPMHPGYDVPNFHRVVVHGSTLPLEWLKLTVDPGANAANGANAFGPFSWTRVILP